MTTVFKSLSQSILIITLKALSKQPFCNFSVIPPPLNLHVLPCLFNVDQLCCEKLSNGKREKMSTESIHVMITTETQLFHQGEFKPERSGKKRMLGYPVWKKNLLFENNVKAFLSLFVWERWWRSRTSSLEDPLRRKLYSIKMGKLEEVLKLLAPIGRA